MHFYFRFHLTAKKPFTKINSAAREELIKKKKKRVWNENMWMVTFAVIIDVIYVC